MDLTDEDSKCRYKRGLALTEHCVLGVKPNADGLMIGDSYAGMYVHFMHVLATGKPKRSRVEAD